MNRQRKARAGYTLIEMMAVVAIVGILVTVAVGAAVRFYGTAKTRATETTIQVVDDAMTQRLESFWAKVNPPVLSRHSVLAGLVGAGVTNESQAIRYRRAQLIAKLEGMRGDFPQQFADFLPAASGGLATPSFAGANDDLSTISSRTRSAIEQEYRRLTFTKNPAAVPNNNVRGQPTQIAPHNAGTESGACLYLMLAVGSGEGKAFDFSLLPGSAVVDTDGDGVPEVCDAWGTPLRFYRWPADLLYYLINNGQIPGSSAENANSFDPELLLARAIWVGAAGGQAFQATGAAYEGRGNYFRITDPNNANAVLSIPIFPIIVSAGPDAVPLAPEDRWQAFGLTWADGTGFVPGNNYTNSWPPANLLEIRCGKPITTPGALGAGLFNDNIYSRLTRSGRESN